MTKLKLDLDHIVVESFDTSPPARAQRGTVRGHATRQEPCTGYTDCAIDTNPDCGTASGLPCETATAAGATCDTTCNQIQCTCTYGGPNNGTCDVNATCNYQATCAHETGCYLYCE